MGRYVARRLVMTGFLVWGVVTIIFLLLRLVPGDVTETILAEGGIVSPAQVEARRHALGLDRPVIVQYRVWLAQLGGLNFGTSLVSERPIGPDIATALPRTLELIGAGLAFGLAAGIPAGVFAATRRGRFGDLVVTVGTLGGLAVPNFVSGTLLVLCFSLLLKWFPTAGYVAFSQDPLGHLRYLLLPGVALGVTLGAIVARFTRAAMLETLGQEYIRTAEAKGLARRRVLYHHALKNAIIPVITVVGLESGALLGGTIVVEYIFNWPGMSTLLLQSAFHRDYPVVQAVVLIIACLFLLLNLGVDLTNAYVDPRIHYS